MLRSLGWACCLLFLSPAFGQAQGLLKQSLLAPGEVAPIRFDADEVQTWTEGEQRLLLLKGSVWVEQNLTSLRATQAIVWIDEAAQRKNGTYRLEVFAEGDAFTPVSLGLSKNNQRTGSEAYLKMGTGGEMNVKSRIKKFAQANASADPLFQRALRVRASNPLPDSDGLVTTTSLPRPSLNPAHLSAPTVQALPTSSQKVPALLAAQEQPIGVPDGVPIQSAPLIGLASPPPGDGPPRQLSIRPRTSQDIQATRKLMPNGETAWIITGSGIILTVSNPKDKKGIIDIEADRLVVWTQGAANPQNLLDNLKGPNGETSQSLEFYLSGNVEIRNQTPKETQIIRADEAYYDVSRNVAVALKADVEMRSPRSIYPLHFAADEVLQLGPKVFEGRNTVIYSTILPSDPGLRLEIREARLEEVDRPRKTIFGKPFFNAKGEELTDNQKLVTGRGSVLRLEGIPIFYLPYIKTDAEDPLGPLDNFSFGFNNIFGAQLMTTFNIFDLLGVTPQPGTRWQLMADYLSSRGPALGTEFNSAGKDLFDIPNKFEIYGKAYGIYDTGLDVLGGERGTMAFTGPNTFVPVDQPEFRGRATARTNIQDLPYGFTFQGQVSAISDRNFLEQYFNQEWTSDLNQETFAYVKQQNGIWAWTGLAQPHLRNWITETEWLPKVDGHLIGMKFFDLFTYNARGSVGYGRLKTTDVPSFAYNITDQDISTGRVDVLQEISLPLDVGPFKIVPYLMGDLAYYTNDLNGDDRGRLYGGGGVRASMPLSRFYSSAQSELFNLNGLFHKMVFSTNAYIADSNVHFNELPQLDRLNDDASDQALRDFRPRLPTFNPSNTGILTSKIVDPQVFALRRLVDASIETLDEIEVVQLGLRQRLQTRRGWPGNDHIVDWMVLDLNATVFPRADRDSFGQTFGILEYDWLWNVGDRTALVSNGWFETVPGGPRVWNIGAVLNRPDRTNFYLGYRQIDPLESKAVVASLTYAFSAKYAMTASTVYDFGIRSQSNSISITRIGTDLMVSVGASYNSVLENFGLIFEIVPNLLPNRSRGGFNPLAGR